ncbi:MAG: response regulator [Opitutus sp.]|nr:response regulator [Opitutus sp.]
MVDDEPAARRGIRLLLERDRGVDVVGEASGGLEARALIRREKPDLAFLHVQMPGGDGFSALEEVAPETMPSVIFVTAYDEHALRAFEVHAVDYLLKPYDDVRFAAALQRAKQEVLRRQADQVNARLTQLLDYLHQKGERVVGPAPDAVGRHPNPPQVLGIFSSRRRKSTGLRPRAIT